MRTMNAKDRVELSLNSLMAFHEVARYKSFCKAAEGLCISQPAVTKHIKTLEARIGLRLIQRGKGGFGLTEEGKALYRQTQKISSQLMRIENLLGSLQKERHGVLRIGTTESYSKCLMPELLSQFQASFPAVKISLDVGNSEEIEKSLLQCRIDLALIAVTKVSNRFESTPFLREELVVIAPPNHPLALRERVSLKEIETYPLIIRAKGSTTRKILLQAFRDLGIRPSLLIEAGSSEFIKRWVSEGRGISVIVRRIVEEEAREGSIKAIPLKEKLSLEVVFLYLKEARFNPTVKAFVGYVEGRRGRWAKQSR